MSRRAVLAAVLAAAALPPAAAAQGAAPLAPADLAGRWAVTLEGGAPPRVRGELRLRDSAETLAGTLFLATHDSAPVPLLDVEIRQGTIEFRAGYEPGMRFVGRAERGRLNGEAFGGAGEQIQTWTAERIADAIDFYPALPRFRFRQLVTSRGDSGAVLPGPWIAATAETGTPPDSMYPAYAAAAAAAGLTPLAPGAVETGAWPYLLGVYRRPEAVGAMRRTLEEIRAGIADPRLRMRFDAIFRGRRREWITDLHDAALDRARRGQPSLEWENARAGLTAAAWLGTADTSAVAVPQALYRLARLRRIDSLGFGLVMERVATAPGSARAVAALLDGYDEAARWHAQASHFLISEPWISGAGGARSVQQLMSAFWGRPVAAPRVEPAWFGYPQAVPQYSTDPQLVERLLEPDNWGASEWLRRNGDRRLLTVVQRLGADSFPPVTVVTEHGPLRLTTVRRLARETANGFLAPSDAILVDPGFPPLLALGTIVHEWQHLEFERARWHAGPEAVPAETDSAGTVVLRPSEPVVAEGFAEWSTEVVLAPLAALHPLLGVGERLKRARFAAAAPDDAHLVGYLLARTLAGAVPQPDATALLVAASSDPTAVLDDPRVARAWNRWRRAPARQLSPAAARLLVPETLFTIEGGWPDVIETRIHP